MKKNRRCGRTEKDGSFSQSHASEPESKKSHFDL